MKLLYKNFDPFLNLGDLGVEREEESIFTFTCVSFRGTSLIRNNPPVGPYSSPMVILGGWVFLVSEVPLYVSSTWSAAQDASTRQ